MAIILADLAVVAFFVGLGGIVFALVAAGVAAGVAAQIAGIVIVIDAVVILAALLIDQALLFAQQGFAIFLRNLVIIGVDFREGKKAVAIAAIIDEGSLQRRLDPGYLGEIDIALDLLPGCCLEIKFLNPVSLDDCNPGFLRVAGVDQHACGH